MNTKLEQAIAAVRELPEQDQQLIADEMLSDVANVQQSQLTDEQRAIVTDRLSRPLETIDAAEMEATYRRYQDGV